MNILQNECCIPHQAIVFTNKNNLDSFFIEKVGIAYQVRKDSIGKNDAIWEVEFHLTNKCNLDCTGCSYSTRHNGKSLTADQVCSILEQYGQYDLRSAFFSGGGDPLTWKEWNDFFIKVKKKCSFGIATNMFNFETIKDFWKEFDFYQIHVTGFDEISSKAVTGVNSYDSVDKNISFLLNHRSSSQEVALKILINKENYQQLPKYLDYVMKKEADSVIIKYQQNFLKNEDLVNDTVIKEIRNFSYEHPIAGTYDFLIDNMDDIIFNTFPHPSKCIFANTGLYRLINADGEIFPCIAANANRNNKISNEKEFVDIYSKEMSEGRCPLKACRHYRFSQYLSQVNLDNIGHKTIREPLLL